jgi:hypothetical protein
VKGIVLLLLAAAPLLPASAPAPAPARIDWEQRLVDKVPLVKRYVAREAKDVFGGISLERDRRPSPYLMVRFTRDRERHEAALKRLFPYPDRLRTVQVAHTLAELEALQERISADREALRAEGFEMTALSAELDGNVVGVDVITRREDAQAFFAARYGDAVRVDVIAREPYKLVSTKAEGYTVSRTGRTLRLRWTTNSVYDLVRVEVRETRRRVTARIVERAPNGPVTLIAVEKQKLLRLQRPLGQREVFDAAARRALPRLKRPAPGSRGASPPPRR